MGIKKASTQSASLVGYLNNGVVTFPADDVSLGELNDVEVVAPKEEDILIYDGNVWKNINIEDYLVQNVYILDGGDADGHEEEPVLPPVFNNYAEELTGILYNLIRSDNFQSNIKKFDGLDYMNMSGNTITLHISKKFSGMLNLIYSDIEVSRLMGQIITSVYDNVSGTIRQVVDNIVTDVWNGMDECLCDGKDTTGYEAKMFIYMSDESVVFYNINIEYTN